MGYREEIQFKARARDIPWLVHFTDSRNLAGIVEHSLLSRMQLEERVLGFIGTDSWRLDGDVEASSLSVTNINCAMLEKKRKEYPRTAWVVVYFQPSVLWTHECRFCFRNASHKDLTGSRAFRGGPWGFDTMFGDLAYRREMGIAPCLPTRSDAEVQVRERIAPELIMGVCVDRPYLVASVQALMDRLNAEDGDDRNVLVTAF